MYAIYCSNYDSAEMYVSRLRKRKDVEVALTVRISYVPHIIQCMLSTPQNIFSNNRVMPGLTLPAYLITPVQRIPRYILLLKVPTYV